MSTHSFTLEEVINQQAKWLNEKKSQITDQKRDIANSALNDLLNFDPKVSNNNHNLSSSSVKKTFEENINKENTVFLIKDIYAKPIDLKAKLNKDKITYDEMYNYLTVEHRLSEDQVNYILASSNSVAGGVSGFKNFTKNGENQTRNMSMIEISKEGDVNYIGTRRIMFDCDASKISTKIKEDFLADFDSKNCITATINVKLQSINNPNETQTIISVDGVGPEGDKIVENLKLIESKLKPEQSKDIVGNYIKITEEVKKVSPISEEYTKTINDVIHFETPFKLKNNSIMRTAYAQEILAKKVVEFVDQQIKKHSNLSEKDIKIIADETAKNLGKFIDMPKGHLTRLSKDIVHEVIQITDKKTKKNVIDKFVSRIRDYFNDYEKIKTGNKKLDIYSNVTEQEQAKRIAKGLSEKFSPKVNNSIQNKKKKTVNNSKAR